MIGELLVLLCVAWPLTLAVTLACRRQLATGVLWSWLVVCAPVPALVAALSVPDAVRVELTWLLLGGVWEVDNARRALLAAAALVWLLAGWQMRSRFVNETHRMSLQLAWLLALTGNIGVMLVHDVAGLYAFFALMSFSAYPLVVLTRTPEALAAGRVYLSFTVLAEVLILCGLLIGSSGEVSPQLSDLPVALAASSFTTIASLCLWTGFGVKTAVAGLHLWLPGVYTHAPPPVAAVLGGAMINAGVLGLLVTLPLGAASLPTLGATIVAVGVVGALGAAFVGVTQRSSTTVLGYSSISQMGLLMIPLGAALHTPKIAPAAVAAITLFAVHHGLAKASLFLGVDVAQRSSRASRPLVLTLLMLVGASLAGAPFTSGAAAKLATKYALTDVASTWPWLTTVLSLAAAGTTVLVLRAVFCLAEETSFRSVGDAAPSREPGHGTTGGKAGRAVPPDMMTSRWPVSWVLSVALVAIGIWWLPLGDAPRAWPGSSASDAVALLWPVALGCALFFAARWVAARGFLPNWRVPAGDLLVPVSALSRSARALIYKLGHATGRVLSVRGERDADARADARPDATRASGTIAHLWHDVRTRWRVKQPHKADSALRSVAPILFGALIVAVLLLLQP